MTFYVLISGRSRCWVMLDMTFCFPLVDVPDTERNMHCPFPLSLSLLSLLSLASTAVCLVYCYRRRRRRRLQGFLVCFAATTHYYYPPPLLFLPCFRFCFAALSLRTFCSIFLSRFFFPCFFLA